MEGENGYWFSYSRSTDAEARTSDAEFGHSIMMLVALYVISLVASNKTMSVLNYICLKLLYLYLFDIIKKWEIVKSKRHLCL